MELARLNALRYRSTRYHPTHLRANMKMTNITPPRTETSQQQALRIHILMGNARAKSTPTQVIETSGEEVAGVIQATDVARMRAIQYFLSENEAD